MLANHYYDGLLNAIPKLQSSLKENNNSRSTLKNNPTVKSVIIARKSIYASRVLNKYIQNEALIDSTKTIGYGSLQWFLVPDFEISSQQNQVLEAKATTDAGLWLSKDIQIGDERIKDMSLCLWMFEDAKLQNALFHLAPNQIITIAFSVEELAFRQTSSVKWLRETLGKIRIYAKGALVFLVAADSEACCLLGRSIAEKVLREIVGRYAAKMGLVACTDKEYFFSLRDVHEVLKERMMKAFFQKGFNEKINSAFLRCLQEIGSANKYIGFEEFSGMALSKGLDSDEIKLGIEQCVRNGDILDVKLEKTKKRILFLEATEFLSIFKVLINCEKDKNILSHMETAIAHNCVLGCKLEVPVFRKTGVLGETLMRKLLQWVVPDLDDSLFKVIVDVGVEKQILFRTAVLPNEFIEQRTSETYFCVTSHEKNQLHQSHILYSARDLFIRWLLNGLTLAKWLNLLLVGDPITKELIEFICNKLESRLKQFRRTKHIQKYSSRKYFLLYFCYFIKGMLSFDYYPLVVIKIDSRGGRFKAKNTELAVSPKQKNVYQVKMIDEGESEENEKAKKLYTSTESCLRAAFKEVNKKFLTNIDKECNVLFDATNVAVEDYAKTKCTFFFKVEKYWK